MMMMLDRSHYRKMKSDELQRRYRMIEDDTSCMTFSDEVGRQFSMQEIGAVIAERGEQLELRG